MAWHQLEAVEFPADPALSQTLVRQTLPQVGPRYQQQRKLIQEEKWTMASRHRPFLVLRTVANGRHSADRCRRGKTRQRASPKPKRANERSARQPPSSSATVTQPRR